MEHTTETIELTHGGALTMLQAAVGRATELGQPQCIVIVDASGELRAEMRMTGAKFLSRKSARAKAVTAASSGAPSENVPMEVRSAIAMATAGEVTGLPGGLPIRINGRLLGGIGVGSGTAEQDIAVAKAALASIGADY